MPDFNPVSVAERIEALRAALDLEKGDFADSVQIDRSSYSKIIKGEKPLKADMAFRIAEKWGVSLDYIYRGRMADLPSNLASKLRMH